MRILSRVGGPRTVYLLLLIVAVVAVAFCGYRGWHIWAGEHRRYGDADYVASASTVARLLLSPSADDDRRIAAVLSDSTGDFHDQFAQSADAYSLFVRGRGVRRVAFVDGTVISVRDGAAASVLVAAYSAPEDGSDISQAQRFRLKMRVEDDGGSLKVSALELVT